ncbi:[Pyruvate dehydrogenase [acetyl-transferring]]-phosphatase 2, mitochondrial [[Candida] anglica]|uniref:[Pyruvate dehydrogenase [acetyl-transferring]]-phosphatase 2, mitochondrial n=1 Tax=[Candida] anglica TaxID=148631 RepID=A0ABP0EJN3_9ASCO
MSSSRICMRTTVFGSPRLVPVWKYRVGGPLTRSVSSSVTFTAIDKSPSTPASENKPHLSGKLRVPLLKSPSHLGHFTSRVNRLYNEDKYSANVLSLKKTGKSKTAGSSGNTKKSNPEVDAHATVFNFSIFDGHGGEQCSTFLKENLAQAIEDSDQLCGKSDKERNELVKKYWKNIGGYWKRWYKHRKDNFAKMMDHDRNQIKLQEFPNLRDDLSVRLPMSFLKLDYDFFESEDNKSGSTATSAFIETIYSEPELHSNVFENYYFNRKSISKLTVAQVGDTRAIIVDKNGEAQALTATHHPSNPEEAARLRKYAANFFMTDSFGEERFISLANTRSFGDLNFKEVGVTSEPELAQFIIGDEQTISKKLTDDEIAKYTIGGLGGDEAFLVLMSDGVTNVITDQEVADIVMVNVNMKGSPKATPQLCAEEVVKFVEYIGGDDNATCLVVRLNGWGKWPSMDRTGELRQERMNDYNPRGVDVGA